MKNPVAVIEVGVGELAAAMQRPHVHLALPDGSIRELENGDMIGRLWSAALVLDDPRISEAHALISLREGAFWMLSLRRKIAVRGRPVPEVRLEAGLEIELADRLCVRVAAIELPAEVLMLEADGFPAIVLPGACSLATRPRITLSARPDPRAPCQIWANGAQWQQQLDGVVRPLRSGDTWQVDGVELRVQMRPLGGSGPNATRVPGGVHAPIHLVACFDTVELHRDGESTVVLGGLSAQLISELVAFAGPVSWVTVARALWPRDDEEGSLRRRWDVALARLRSRLRAERLRPDLVHADGSGQVTLLLRDCDRVEDRT